MDKLQFFFDTLLGEPKALMGSPNNDMVMINCLNELREPAKVNVKISDKKDSKALSQEALKNQICELIEKVFQDEYFENLNDEIIKTQLNSLELSVKLGNSDKVLKKINNFKDTYKVNTIVIYLEFTSVLINKLIYVIKQIISNEHNNEWIREQAIKRITSQNILARLNQNEINDILEFLIPVLKQIIINESLDISIRKQAIERITSQDILARLNQNEINDILEFLIPVLKQIIINESLDISIRKQAIERITSQNILARLNQNEINDILEFLKQIISNEYNNQWIREQAIERLILKKGSNEWVKYIQEKLITPEIFSMELIKTLINRINEFSPITLDKKDEKEKKKIEEQKKQYQSLNHKLLIYYFNEPELKDEFKKYSMKYNMVYYEKSDVWYCFDNYLEKEIKVPTSFDEELQKTPRYNLINEILDSISKDKAESLEEMIKDNLRVEQMIRYLKLSKEQVEAYISKVKTND